jgi:LPXTG-site transpeptidase (sortase) family protein
MKLLGHTLFTLGTLLWLVTALLYWQRINPNRLKIEVQSSSLVSSSDKSDGLIPVAVVSGSLSIKLPVFQAEVEGNKWPATSKGVSYLSSTALPGEMGNSVLYGHNWPNLLGNLTKAQEGDDIVVVFSDGSRKKFIIDSTFIVTPDSGWILSPTDDTRITIYTCTGFLDSKRFVAVAKYTEDLTPVSLGSL